MQIRNRKNWCRGNMGSVFCINGISNILNKDTYKLFQTVFSNIDPV